MPLNTELKEGGGSQVKFNVTHQKSPDPPPPPAQAINNDRSLRT